MSDPRTFHSLEYAPPPPWRRRWRRIAKHAAIFALILVGVIWGPAVWRQVRSLYWQHECLVYVAPANQVVYDDDPARTAALLKQNGYFSYGWGANFMPECWFKSSRMVVVTGISLGAVLFLHERRSPDGHRRLVVLELAGPASAIPLDSSSLTLIEPATLAHGPTIRKGTLSVDLAPLMIGGRSISTFRFFAGKPDPANPSHFTVRFDDARSTGTIDGWLDNNDHVRLKIVSRATTQPAENEIAGHMDIAGGNISITQLTMTPSLDRMIDARMLTSNPAHPAGLGRLSGKLTFVDTTRPATSRPVEAQPASAIDLPTILR